MKLLITTPRYVFLFNTDTGKIKLIRVGDGEYYGITWTRDQLYMTHSIVDCINLVTWEDYRKSKGGYLSHINKNEFTRSNEMLLVPHQIECVDDRILVTNTGLNCLSVYDLNGELCRHIYFNKIRWDLNPEGKTGNHFNSVHRVKDKIYVVAHNQGRPSEVYILSWPSLELLRVVTTKIQCAHNYWPCEHGTFICNSRDGSVYDLDSDQVVWVAPEKNIFTRGFAANKDYLFVGRSEFGKRSERMNNTGGVYVIDRKNLQTLDVFKFPASGCVNDIRLVSEVDDCHSELKFNLDWISLIKSTPICERYNYLKRKLAYKF